MYICEQVYIVSECIYVSESILYRAVIKRNPSNVTSVVKPGGRDIVKNTRVSDDAQRTFRAQLK